jgi:hypothetical protein
LETGSFEQEATVWYVTDEIQAVQKQHHLGIIRTYQGVALGVIGVFQGGRVK